jgi:hypothetical protein
MVYGCFVLSGWVTGVTGYCYGLLGRIIDGLIGYDGYIFFGYFFCVFAGLYYVFTPCLWRGGVLK